MNETELKDFLQSVGLAQNSVKLTRLKGGYLNSVWRVDTDRQPLVAKCFATPMTGTLFPNLPDDEAKALRRLKGLDVAPELAGFWPDHSLLVYRYVDGDMWDGDVAAVAELILRKEAADCADFRAVPLTADDILAEGDALFKRCQSNNLPTRPVPIDLPPPARLSLIHTDIGVNLVGKGSGLRLIDWQCPAAGDICEDIYSFLSPAFQILGLRSPLTSAEIEAFWTALNRPALRARYQQLQPYFAWRFAGYCCWREAVLDDAEICQRYQQATAAELRYMQQGR